MKIQFASVTLVTLLAFSLTSAAFAQQPTPSPEQAPQVLSMLDKNGDKKLSPDEAQGGLKDNFALVDSNGDGEIDLDELRGVLKMAAQRVSGGGQRAKVSTTHDVRPRVHRTPESRFANIEDFPFDTHYIDIDGLRMAYVDEGTGKAGTFLLLHGEPVWSYMYRGAIPGLAAAGYRVIAPDNIGFGRSDKVIDIDWYTLDNHVQSLKRLVTKLDLRNITIVVNDWGGPNGLVMATEMPNRFDRLIILNTWLHFAGYRYTQALRDWNQLSQSIDFTGFPAFPSAVRAPFDSPDAVAGALRWPWMLPFAEPEAGNAVRQEAAWNNLASWDKPAHVIFGDSDRVFTEDWGRQFAAHIPGATFTCVEGEGHRPLLFTGPAAGQFTGEHHGDEFAELVLRLISTE